MRTLVLALGLVLCGVAITMCGKSSPVGTANPGDPEYRRISVMPDDTAKLRLLGDYIRAYIADRSCSGSGQCRTIAFGNKPCGGPWAYLIYSTATADSTVVRALAREYFVVDSTCNRKYRLVSDCYPEPEPLIGCINGECARVWP